MKSRISIVGLGFWGKYLLNTFNVTPGVEVVAVYSRSPKRLDEISLGNMHYYSNLEEMFEKEKMDATIICEIPPNHLLPTQLAAERGIHVFCEKPMAANLEDCDAMMDVCKKQGVKLMIGYKHRFAKATAYVKEHLDKLGKPLWAMHTYPLWKVEDPGWKFDENGTNGIIIENMVHSFDLLRYLVGDIQSLYAEGNHSVFKNAKAPDSTVITLRFVNGAIGAVGGGCTSDERISKEYLDLHFENGIAQLTGRLDRPFHLKMLMRAEAFPDEHIFEGSDGIREEAAHFIDCIQNNKEPLATGTDGKMALKIALAVGQSIRENSRIVID
jgi:predicted dehydrogenase